MTQPRPTLWIVNHYADAPDRANGTRHYDFARRLVERGFDVTIFASSFSHVTGAEERLRPGQLYRSELFDGVRFIWLRTMRYRGNGVRRQINMLSFVATLLVVQTRFRAPDAIIGSTVHPFAALGGWVVSKLRRATFMFEVRDLWPQTLVDLGAMRVGSPGERLLRMLEAFLVRRATVVITLLPGMRDYLLERGLPAGHVRYIPNGVDLKIFDEASASDAPELAEFFAAVQRMRAEGRVVLAYVGAMGRVNAVGTIVTAAAIAEARSPGSVGVLLVGDGPERPRLERQVATADGVEIIRPVPKRLVPTILRAIDAGIVHTASSPIYRYGMSFNKLFEYLAAARPVVFACESAYDPVAMAGCGISLPPMDPDRLADAFLQIAAAGLEERSRMGRAGRDYVSREHDIEQLAATIARLTTSASRPRS